MKYIHKNRYSLSLLFFILILITLSCSDKPNKEKTSKKIVTPTVTEGIYYIDSIYKKNGKSYATIDMIEYEKITDSSDQNKQNKIDLPNGYYIINEKAELIEKPLADSVTITMQTLHYDEYGNFKYNEKINLDELIKTLSNPENKRYKHIPFKITLTNNKITSITEIYIP